MSDTPAGWEGILDPGEVILWQGRPGGGLYLRGRDVIFFLFGMVFCLFALVWMLGTPGLLSLTALPHFCAGLAIAFGGPLWSMIRRRGTWYTLTTRRAIIATDLPVLGKQLNSHPIDARTGLRLLRHARTESLHFAEEVRRGRNGTYKVPIGFDHLTDANAVMGLIRDIQAGNAQRAGQPGPREVPA